MSTTMDLMSGALIVVTDVSGVPFVIYPPEQHDGCDNSPFYAQGTESGEKQTHRSGYRVYYRLSFHRWVQTTTFCAVCTLVR